MLLVVVAAGELAIFQDVWEIIVIPPITMSILALNLGFGFLVLRPRTLERRVIGMMCSGIATSFAMIAYLAMSFDRVPLRGGAGFFGRFIQGALSGSARFLRVQNGALDEALQWLSTHVSWLEFALLDAVGVGLLWYGGRLETWLRRRWPRPRAASPASLDDPAATPL
jgi:hypothetical protein